MAKQEISKVVSQYMIPDLADIVFEYYKNPKPAFVKELDIFTGKYHEHSDRVSYLNKNIDNPDRLLITIKFHWSRERTDLYLDYLHKYKKVCNSQPLHSVSAHPNAVDYIRFDIWVLKTTVEERNYDQNAFMIDTYTKLDWYYK
jgi:hypothetical protein